MLWEEARCVTPTPDSRLVVTLHSFIHVTLSHAQPHVSRRNGQWLPLYIFRELNASLFFLLLAVNL